MSLSLIYGEIFMALNVQEKGGIFICKVFDLFIKEVDALREADGRLLESKNYEVFFASAKEIPNLLHEIGRLRWKSSERKRIRFGSR